MKKIFSQYLDPLKNMDFTKWQGKMKKIGESHIQKNDG